MPENHVEEAVRQLLSPDELAELDKHLAAHADLLRELDERRERSLEWLRTGNWERPVEVLEQELHAEHQELVRQQTAKLRKQIRRVLEAWSAREEWEIAHAPDGP